MQQGKLSLLMQSWFGASWKTTVMGIVGAAMSILYPFLTSGNFDLKRDWKQLGLAAFVFVFGKVTKDANVTGGNVDNGKTPTP